MHRLPESIGDDTLYALQNIMDEAAFMSGGEYDLANMREEDFHTVSPYTVNDVEAPPGVANRAEATLPKNLLVLKPSQALSDVS